MPKPDESGRAKRKKKVQTARKRPKSQSPGSSKPASSTAELADPADDSTRKLEEEFREKFLRDAANVVRESALLELEVSRLRETAFPDRPAVEARTRSRADFEALFASPASKDEPRHPEGSKSEPADKASAEPAPPNARQEEETSQSRRSESGSGGTIALRPFDDWPEVRIDASEVSALRSYLDRPAAGLEGERRREALRMDPADLALYGQPEPVAPPRSTVPVDDDLGALEVEYVPPQPAGQSGKSPQSRRRQSLARNEKAMVEERFPTMAATARAAQAGRSKAASAVSQASEDKAGARLPSIPAGPPGLVYLIEGSGPISGTGVLRVLYRHPPNSSEGAEGAAGGRSDSAIVTPVPVDKDLPKRSQDPLDQNIIAVLQKLPRHSTIVDRKSLKAGKKKQGKQRPVTKADQCATMVTEKAWRVLLPWLLETKRCYVAAAGAAEAAPLTLDPQPPLEFHLLVERIPRRGDYHLTCRFVRGQKILLYKSQIMLVTDGEKGFLLRRSGKLSAVDFGGSASWLRALRRGKFRHVSRKKVPTLLKTFDRSTTLPPMHLPSSLKIEKLEGLSPMPELHLDSGQQEISAEVTFRYGEDSVRGARAGKRFFSLKTRHLITRNLEAEAAHAVDLLRQGFSYDQTTHRFTMPADKLPQAAAALFGMGWTLHGKKMPFRPPTDMEVNVTTGADYIDVDVKVYFGEESVDITQLLEAIHEGNRMVVLKSGALGVLPGDWLDKNAAWMELGQLHEGKLRFRKIQSALIDALVAEKIKARLDEGFHAERARLSTFEGIRETNPTPGFRGTLRKYQKLGLGWLLFLDKMAWGGCLADDMGLGKTVQALALLQYHKENGRQGTSLIVTPKSLIFNWLREAKRFTPSLKVLNYTGLRRNSAFEDFPEYDMVITTYGTMRRDAERLSQFRFFYLILDEGQAIKNAESQNAKAASLLQGERRLILSGTPVENHLGELWSLFDFINPGMLGSYSAFKKRFSNGRNPDAGSLAILRRTLRPFILRRKKEEVTPDLPEKIEETILCEMEPEQKQVYQEVKERCRNSVLALVKAKGLARSKIHILEALLRLRQAACHPALIDEKYAELASGKISAFLSMVEEVQEAGHKVLVFSQFTSLLAIVRKEMERLGIIYEYLDGQTRDRAARVDRFQTDPDCRFFLISLKAGGLGLNLTAADYVFILDPWWNPAVEAQAIDRAHRIGQDKKVFAYRFVSKDSIEERITEMQESKRKLADAIIAADESFIRNLTKEDLEVLFS